MNQTQLNAAITAIMMYPDGITGTKMPASTALTERLLQQLPKVIRQALKIGYSIRWADFGTFKTMMRSARNIRDVNTHILTLYPQRKIARLRTHRKTRPALRPLGSECQQLAYRLKLALPMDIMPIRSFLVALSFVIKQQINLNGSVTIQHLGQFTPYETKARMRRNRRTGLMVSYPSIRKILWLPADFIKYNI